MTGDAPRHRKPFRIRCEKRRCVRTGRAASGPSLVFSRCQVALYRCDRGGDPGRTGHDGGSRDFARGPVQIEQLEPDQLAVWISAAPEPQRSALALFYLDEFSLRRNAGASGGEGGRAVGSDLERPPPISGVAGCHHPAPRENEPFPNPPQLQLAGSMRADHGKARDRSSDARRHPARASGEERRLPFAQQQAFDAAIARLVRAIPVDAQVAEWFANESLIPLVKRRWKKILLNPVVLAIALAFAVIGGVFAYRVHQHLHDFPGADKARRLLSVAARPARSCSIRSRRMPAR